MDQKYFLKFFKPTKWKIFGSFILLTLSLFYKRPNYCFDANCYPRGAPLPFVDEFSSGFLDGIHGNLSTLSN